MDWDKIKKAVGIQSKRKQKKHPKIQDEKHLKKKNKKQLRQANLG